MFNQHAKWLNVTKELPWQRPIASLSYPHADRFWSIRPAHNLLIAVTTADHSEADRRVCAGYPLSTLVA